VSYKDPDPHIHIRIKMEQNEKRWGYSCPLGQYPHIRVGKQRPEKMIVSKVFYQIVMTLRFKNNI